MKAFKILTALCVGLSFTTFVSCSSDDDSGENGGTNLSGEKKLLEIEIIGDDELDYECLQFDYNSKGELMSVTEKYSSNNYYITSYTWNDNLITQEDDYQSITYTVDDSLIRTGKSSNKYGNYAFTYNSSKRLKTLKNSGYTYTVTWDNDKITKIVSGEYSDTYITHLSYDGKICKGYFPLLNDLLDDRLLFYAYPELIGIKNNHLPNEITIECNPDDIPNDYDKSTISYALDNSGYVESCNITYYGRKSDSTYSEIETLTYKFKWE